MFIGKIASFNWDTSASTVATKQTHLSSQYYDICIRRARGHCSVCYSPTIHTTDTTASSFGISAGNANEPQTSAVGTLCTGVTVIDAATVAKDNKMMGFGDYLDIDILQPSTTAAAATITPTISRICGTFWNAAEAGKKTHATACTFSYPFKIGVHFDDDEAIATAPTDALLTSADFKGKVENGDISDGSGRGFQGFYLNYWQNSCP